MLVAPLRRCRLIARLRRVAMTWGLAPMRTWDRSSAKVMLLGCGSAAGQRGGPSVASGARVPVPLGGRSTWSGRVWEGAETGEDLGEQVVTGWEAQGQAAGVADQTG